MDLNSDPDCGRTMDSHVVLGSSLHLDVTIAPGDSQGHPDRHGTNGSMASGHQQGPGWPSRPLESTWYLMAIGAKDINTGPGCGRATEKGHFQGAIEQIHMCTHRDYDVLHTAYISSSQATRSRGSG